jgi:hypothetical protein
MKILRKFQNKFEFPLNCLPNSFLKKKFVKQVRELFYDYIKFNVRSWKFVPILYKKTASGPSFEQLVRIWSKLNTIFKKRNLVVKGAEIYPWTFEDSRVSSKLLHFPEKVNILLISQLSETQFGLSAEERSESSLFLLDKYHIIVICKKDISEDSLKSLKLKIIEYTSISTSIGNRWISWAVKTCYFS